MILRDMVPALGDQWTPATEPRAMVLEHGSGRRPVYVLRSNPVSLVRVEGATIPIYSILTAHRTRPLEHAMEEELRDTVPVRQGPALGVTSPTAGSHPRTAAFRLLDVSPVASLRAVEGKGDLTYGP